MKYAGQNNQDDYSIPERSTTTRAKKDVGNFAVVVSLLPHPSGRWSSRGLLEVKKVV